MLKYSFLIPVYNVEKSIEKCLSSLLGQTYKGNYEIVLYEDVSTDKSKAICQKYQALYPTRVRLIEGSVNIGLGAGRVQLAKNALGEYIIFVDSDDYVEPTLLEKVDNALNLDENIDMVLYDYFAEYNFLGRKKYLKRISCDESKQNICLMNKNDILKELYTGKINAIWRKAFKKELFDIEKLSRTVSDLSMGEDLFFSLNIMSKAEKYAYIPEPLYYWVQNLSSMTHTKYSTEKLHSFCKVLNLLYMDVLDKKMDKTEGVKRYFIDSILGVAFSIAITEVSQNQKNNMYDFLMQQKFIEIVSEEKDNSIGYLLKKDYLGYQKSQRLNKLKAHVKDEIKKNLAGGTIF